MSGTFCNPIRIKSLLLRWVLSFILMLLNACAHSPNSNSAPKPANSYESLPISDAQCEISHKVYIFGNKNAAKPPVLLLHELPGLSDQTIEYAKFLAKDFAVYAPLLFGEFGQDSAFKGLMSYTFNGEWNTWCYKRTPMGEKYKKRPIVSWLGKRTRSNSRQARESNRRRHRHVFNRRFASGAYGEKLCESGSGRPAHPAVL